MIIEFLIRILVFIFIEFIFVKIFKPIFRFIGVFYLKTLNIFLKNKIDIEISPNKTFIGFLIFLVALFALINYGIYA